MLMLKPQFTSQFTDNPTDWCEFMQCVLLYRTMYIQMSKSETQIRHMELQFHVIIIQIDGPAVFSDVRHYSLCCHI